MYIQEKYILNQENFFFQYSRRENILKKYLHVKIDLFLKLRRVIFSTSKLEIFRSYEN